MRIYIAAPWQCKAQAQKAAAALRREGHSIVSTWFEGVDEADAYNETTYRAHAERDLSELGNADTLVVLNLEKSEGKAVEFGVALDAFMRLVVIGQRSHVNIFHYLQTVEHFETLDAFIEAERHATAATHGGR